jgi:TolB protein
MRTTIRFAALGLVGGLLLVSGLGAVERPVGEMASAEGPYLSGHVQITDEKRFLKAGEAYFDHRDPPEWIVFQAIERPRGGEAPSANYAMYAARLTYAADGMVTGIQAPVLLSQAGSANTCGWFDPTNPRRVVFGSTIVPPTSTDAPGYSKDRQRYSWQFPPETEVVSVLLPEGGSREGVRDPVPVTAAVKMFERPGYDAEGSFSPDGRFYLYTHVDTSNNDPNLWIFDTKTGKHTAIVTARGYDGGPFFHPEFPKVPVIVYRSDRKGDNNLQVFLGEVAFGDGGDKSVPIGLARETQITADEGVVSWCPYFHPSGGYVVYATSAVSHGNYEVFAIKIAQDVTKLDAETVKVKDWPRARVTEAAGFDGLPVFDRGGKLMMWTSQRGAKVEGESRASSQLWIAKVTGEPAWGAAGAAEPPNGKSQIGK